jgi:hypothetical protein
LNLKLNLKLNYLSFSCGSSYYCCGGYPTSSLNACCYYDGLLWWEVSLI